MTELLLKLKKGGKHIGNYWICPHLYTSTGPTMVRGHFCEPGDNRWTPRDLNTIDFDSIHPFVCKDRNGKDVFEGDRIRGHKCYGSQGPFKGDVVWHDEHKRFEVQLGPLASMQRPYLTFTDIWQASIQLVEAPDHA
jgi:hypothetical protein